MVFGRTLFIRNSRLHLSRPRAYMMHWRLICNVQRFAHEVQSIPSKLQPKLQQYTQAYNYNQHLLLRVCIATCFTNSIKRLWWAAKVANEHKFCSWNTPCSHLQIFCEVGDSSCIASCVVCVTIDGVWIGERIYWPLIHTTRNYKRLKRYCWSTQFTNHHSTR
jgi:hypothetical protein